MSTVTYEVAAVDTCEGGFGVEEQCSDGRRWVLCECNHATAEEALRCGAPRSVPDLARAAFEAYGASTGGKTWDGKPIPPFDVIRQNTPHVAAAWEAAADAVRKQARTC